VVEITKRLRSFAVLKRKLEVVEYEVKSSAEVQAFNAARSTFIKIK
jgi:hypothetical protein